MWHIVSFTRVYFSIQTLFCYRNFARERSFNRILINHTGYLHLYHIITDLCYMEKTTSCQVRPTNTRICLLIRNFAFHLAEFQGIIDCIYEKGRLRSDSESCLFIHAIWAYFKRHQSISDKIVKVPQCTYVTISSFCSKYNQPIRRCHFNFTMEIKEKC